MMDFKGYCQKNIEIINNYLETSLNNDSISNIEQAMRYSLLAGGKRLRPLLLMATVDTVVETDAKYLDIAAALEMIHTYSLIHDDLPALDNDDYRRGKLTNHKVFGEDIAILAGDALLTAAFECISRQKAVEASLLIEIIGDIAKAAGRSGMVGGQTVDVQANGEFLTYEALQKMHEGKTGALFKVAVLSGGKLAGASAEQLKALEKFADVYGLVFQITDDILDVEGDFKDLGKPVGSDARNGKVTYVSTHGLQGAKDLVVSLVQEATEALQIFGKRALLLTTFLQQLLTRKN